MMAKYKKLIFVLRSPYKLGYENSEGKKKKKIQREMHHLFYSAAVS